MKRGHYCLQGGYVGGGVNFYWNAAPIVFNHDRPILFNGNHDFGAAANHGFVNAVIDDFTDQMVQSTLVGAANIHARSPAYCFSPTQDLNILGGILIIFRLSWRRGILCHN